MSLKATIENIPQMVPPFQASGLDEGVAGSPERHSKNRPPNRIKPQGKVQV
jgi:hypothetical protein